MTPSMSTTTERDFVTHPLTELEKAYLSLASFDLTLSSLRGKIESLLRSRRKLSSAQSAVLTNLLDDLTEEAAKPAPKWPTSS